MTIDVQDVARWAPPIESPEEARVIIQTVWMPAVSTYDFPVRHKDPAQREAGKENRRRILLALGELGIERGSINVAADSRAIAKRTGISHKTVAKHLKAEARAKTFIRLKARGQSNPEGGFATVYQLLVDRLRSNARGDRRGNERGSTTQALQALNNLDNQSMGPEPLKAPPPNAPPPSFGPPPGWQPPVADP